MSETANTLRSSATSRVVIAMCEGEIGGLVDGHKSVYFGDTPLQASDGTYNFQGVTVETRNGTPDQTYLAGFPAVENDVSVEADVTFTGAITRRIDNASANAARVRVQLTQGLMSQNSSTGDLNASSVSVAIEVRPSGGVFTRLVEDTITGKTTSAYEKTYRVDLTGSAPWDLRVVRLTADSETAYLRNATRWSSYTEIIDRKCTYPNTALLGVAVDGQKFGSSVPTLSAEIYGRILLVPANYDPATRAYTGIWDGTFKLAWSDNAAWCFYDMILNPRYGLGIADSGLKWYLYEIAQYCDGMVPDGYGGLEPRFTCNLVLNTQEDAYQVISSLASIFRGMAYWASGSVACSQDRPEGASHLVTPAHVVDGALSYGGTDLKSRHTVCLVTWNDPSDGGKTAVEVVEDAAGIRRYGWRQTDKVSVGCRSRGQARRCGKWVLETELNETDTLTFVGGLQYADAMPGSILKVLDPEIADVRHSGAVKSALVDQVVLDAPVTIEAGEAYLLSVVLPEGTVADASVVNAPGETDTLDLAAPLSAAPLPNAMWTLSYGEAEARYFRVLANRETKPHLYEISAVEHDPNKYARVEENFAFDAPTTSRVPTGPLAAPTGLSMAEYLYTQGTGMAAGVLFSWAQASDARALLAEVQVQRPGEEYSDPKTTSQCSLDIRELSPGPHSFRVRWVSRLGSTSPWATLATVNVTGLSQPLPDVTGLACVVQSGQRILVYDPAADPRPVQYVFRCGPRWGAAQPMGSTPLTQFQVPGNGTWLVKASSGPAESVNAAVIVVTGSEVVANVIATRDEAAEGWTGDCTGGARIIGGAVRLVGTGDLRQVTDIRSVHDLRSLGCIASEGVYQIAEARRIVLSGETLCNVLLDYAVQAVSSLDDFRMVPDVRALTDVRGDFSSSVAARPQIRTFLGAAWSNWRDFLPGQYAGQEYDFRLVLSSLRGDVYPVLTSLSFSVDVPDRVDTGRVPVPVEGLRIIYATPFHDNPKVLCQILSALGGEDVEVTDDDATGFFVRVKSGGAYAARLINWIAQGY